jgi:HlyD family secretion protein
MWNRRIVIAGVLVVVVAGLVYGFWPEATPVTIEQATRDSLRVTVEEEGRTRLREPYVVSAPTTGYLKRVPGAAGDTVRAGQVLARLATLPSKVLDASDLAAAAARVRAARAALRRAEEEAAGAEAALEYARAEYERLQRLQEQGTASPQQLDQARVEFRKAQAQRRAAEQAVAQARGELQAAQSRLPASDTADEARAVRRAVRAPADGRILEVHRQSAGVVQAGAPLVTVGNPDSLEVTVDVLSADAVRIAEGTPVEIVRWGGEGPLHGRVRRVPPRGRTEVSALGVEEQRVDVVVAFTDPPSRWARLGAGYRVVARFVLWAEDNVLQVPQSALFRHDDGWAVFAVEDGRARRTPVTVGCRSGLRVQITDGLAAGDRVVTHPGTALDDGDRVRGRDSP